MPLLCPLCPSARTENLHMNIRDYLKHVRLFHAHQPNFCISCGVHGCQRTFQNFSTFKNHISDMHELRETLSQQQTSPTHFQQNTDEDSSLGDFDEDVTDDLNTEDVLSITQRSSAYFLMGLKEEKKITQAALQGVIEGVTTLSQARLSLMYREVNRIMKADGVAQSTLTSIKHLFDDTGVFGHPFLGLETQHQQMKYYSNHFGLIDPVRVTLGERRVWKGAGVKRKCVVKKDELVYVPLLKTLQAYLSNSFFVEQIKSGHFSSSGFMEDYCDGEAFRSHPLFARQRNAFQILLYYDEVEMCNPLGSKRKIHKLGMFYFNLGNIHPKHRSKLSSIQLLCIVKSNHVTQYGMDAILKPIVADIKELEGGVCFEVGGTSEVYYGTIAAVSADNLGSLLLGGFKESCTASRCCRHCFATRDDSKLKFLEGDFALRDKAKHEQHCFEIQRDATGEKSKEYGVNRDSVLNTLSFFHVCDGALLPDIMHDLLEGALQYEVKLMLRVMIDEEEYFSLEFLNSRLENIELGYMESRNRPTPLSLEKIRSPTGLSLKQNATQMWLLARILPLLVGDCVPDDDERWENFLTLMEIVDRLFCPRLTEDDATYLRWLISDHHNDFVSLYPDMSVIPKMHFMIHMPRLIVQFGPLVRHWTMRFEAKHSYFKQLAQSMGNFINLPYSLAMRQQQLQCYKNGCNTSATKCELTVGPGSVVIQDKLQEKLREHVLNSYLAKWIVLNGTEYKTGAGIVYDMEDDLPRVGQITGIFVVNSNKVLFEVDCFDTYYQSHFRCYVLQSLQSSKLVFVNELKLINPLHIHSASALPGHRFVILPHYVNS